ncbi:MAG TPA: hypothetical protein H9778_10425 [Candidatus Parabacteroides intestinavium]|nr:hypothetical protein [Candidatus Parabacteroides intestinavium]
MDEIKKLLYQGEVDKAICQLTEYLQENPESDEAYYLLGNAWRKKGDNRLALNNYLEAIHRNPESPAQKAYDMLMDILDFYYKEMYNQ